MSGSVSGLSFRKLYWEARNELISTNAVTIFIVESLLKAVHDCIERVQIARPMIFSSTRISAMIRLSVWHCAEARFSNESTFSYAHKKAAATCLATAFRNCLAYDIPNDSSVG